MSVYFRLIGKLENCLALDGETADAREIASQYADACAKANARLNDCMDLLRGGSTYAALQMAESPPPLLDTLAALAFHNAAVWRELCAERGFPLPVEFNERAVRKIEALYTRQIKAAGTLYKEFRKAALARDLPQTVTILRALTAANPDDNNAAQQLRQFEQALLDKRLQAAVELLESGDSQTAIDRLDAIEDEHWSIALKGPLIEKLRSQRRTFDTQEHSARLREVFAILENALRDQRWHLAGNAIRQAEAIQAAGLVSADAGQLGLLDQARVQVEREMNHLDLQNRISEACLASHQKIAEGATASILRKSREKLRKLEIELQQTPTEDRQHWPAQLQQCSQRLHQAIAKKQGMRRLYLAVTVGCALLVAGVIFYLGMRHSHSRDLIDRSDTLLEQRQITEAQTLLQIIQAGGPPWTASNIRERQSRKLESMLRHEQALWQNFQQLESEVRGTQARSMDVENSVRVSALMRQYLDGFEHLAPEYQLRAESNLRDLRDNWLVYQQRVLDGLQDSLQRDMREARMLLRLDQSSPPSLLQLRQDLPQARQVLQQARSRIDSAPSDFEVNAALITQLNDLEAEASKLSAALAEHDALMRELRLANDLQAYLDILKALAENPLQQSPEVRIAGQVLQHERALQHPGRLYYLKASEAVSAFLERTTEPSVNPGTLLPGEEAAVIRMLEDPTIRYLPDAMYYDLVSLDSRSAPVRVRSLYSRGVVEPRSREGMGIPEQRFVFEEITPGGLQGRDFGFRNFSDQRRSGQALENPRPVNEGRLARAVMDGFDRRAVVFTRPPLELLDEVLRARDSSPLFRAQLALALLRIMSEREVDWGLYFSPTARELRENLEILFGGGNIPPGWWMRPEAQARVAEFDALLAPYADPVQAASTVGEARRIQSALMQLRDQAFEYEGFVDAGLNLVRNNPAPWPDELAGLRASDQNLGTLSLQDGYLRPRPMAGTPLLSPSRSVKSVINAFQDETETLKRYLTKLLKTPADTQP